MTIRLLAAPLLALAAFATPAVAALRCTPDLAATRQVVPAVGAKPVALHVPSGWTGDTPAPLVLLLHGSGSTGAAMLRDAGLAATADRHGFLLAYPDGGIAADRGFVWNIPGVPTVAGTFPGPGERDDVAYLLAAIDRLVRAGCADPARVYVTGLSGGGRMTSWLGCVAAGRFAAIAPVVGLRAGNPLAAEPSRPDPASCRPSHPLSVVAFAGDADTTNPIGGGGAGYWRYPMSAALQRWAALDGCTAAPVTRRVAPKVYEQRYDGCQEGRGVIARISVGEGHRWVADNEALWALLSGYRRD